jgi:MFS family permease
MSSHRVHSLQICFTRCTFMSLLSQTPTPPEDSWDTLREWRMRTYWQRYKVAIAVMLRLISVVVAFAAIALFFLEPSWRTVFLVLAMWCIAVPLCAVGYVRKMDRLALRVPISPARNDPTTTVDIQTRQQ